MWLAMVILAGAAFGRAAEVPNLFDVTSCEADFQIGSPPGEQRELRELLQRSLILKGES